VLEILAQSAAGLGVKQQDEKRVFGVKSLRKVSPAAPRAFRKRNFQTWMDRLLTYLARSWWGC